MLGQRQKNGNSFALRVGARRRYSMLAIVGADRNRKTRRIRTQPAICSISLHQAVYCKYCNTISNSRPYRCGVCGSEAVLRVEPILNRDPDPPGRASFPIHVISHGSYRSLNLIKTLCLRFYAKSPGGRSVADTPASRSLTMRG